MINSSSPARSRRRVRGEGRPDRDCRARNGRTGGRHFLAKAGYEVTLYEQAAEEKALGAGFLLQPTGLAVLAELGLAEAMAW